MAKGSEGVDLPVRGRPWKLALEDRLLLLTVYWRTNLTMRQLAALFGVSKSTANRVIGHLGPKLALQPRQRFARDAVLIVDGTLVPTRDHKAAAPKARGLSPVNGAIQDDSEALITPDTTKIIHQQDHLRDSVTPRVLAAAELRQTARGAESQAQVGGAEDEVRDVVEHAGDCATTCPTIRWSSTPTPALSW